EVLARKETRPGDVEISRQVEQPREDPHHIRDVLDAGRDLLETRRREAERVVGADDRPHARAGDEVDGDALALEDVEDADVREPPRGAAAKGQADAPPREIASEASEGVLASGLVDRKRHHAASRQRRTGTEAAVVDVHDTPGTEGASGRSTLLDPDEHGVRQPR